MNPKRGLSYDVWGKIAEFSDLKILSNIMLLNKKILSIANSDYSWKRRCLQEFPPEQLLRMKNWVGEDHRKIFFELRFCFANKIKTCPNFTKSVSIYRDAEDRNTIFLTDPVDGYFTYELDDVEVFRNRIINIHLRDWFECDQNCVPSINFRIGILKTTHGQRGVDVQVGLVRFIFQLWDALEGVSRFTVCTSTCFGTLCKKTATIDLKKGDGDEESEDSKNQDRRFFTSTWVVFDGSGVDFGTASEKRYAGGRSTTVVPEKESDINQQLCERLQDYHESLFGEYYELDEEVMKTFTPFRYKQFDKAQYFVFGFESKNLFVDGRVSPRFGKLYFEFLEVPNMGRMKIIRGFFEQEKPEKKRFKLMGSTLERYISVAVYTCGKEESEIMIKRTEFFFGGRILLLGGEMNTKITGIVYEVEDETLKVEEKEKIHAVFEAVPHREEKKRKVN